MKAFRLTLYKGARGGFTFVEIAVVIVIIAVISGMGLTATLGYVQSAKHTSTDKRLDAIETALMAFRLAHGRLPCPGSETLAASDPNFGVEGAATYPIYSPTATSYNCITGTPHANFYWGAYTNNVAAQFAEGAVPVVTLNLPKEYIYDAWGRHFSYAVDVYATLPNSFNSMRPTDTCILTVQDSAHATRTAGAIYVLLSYGPNGHGGFINSSTRMSSGSTDPDELANCHCDSTGATTTAVSYAP